MAAYDWDFAIVLSYKHELFDGFLGTLKIGFSSLAIGIVVGLLLAVMRLQRIEPQKPDERGTFVGFLLRVMRLAKYLVIKAPAIAIIEFFRATPVLVLLFWCYYAMPIVIGPEWGTWDAFEAVVFTLGLQTGAFMAEVYRAGIVSIDRSQWEGGRAIGMTTMQLMRRIILPQAIRRMVPPFLERSFELMKTTTQASIVTYGELLYTSMVLQAQLYRPLEILTIVALFYLVMLTIASFTVRYIETRMDAARL